MDIVISQTKRLFKYIIKIDNLHLPKYKGNKPLTKKLNEAWIFIRHKFVLLCKQVPINTYYYQNKIYIKMFYCVHVEQMKVL